MKDLPLLSICIAAYNVEQYIEECLNSIRDIEKEYTNKEIIIVNDCSKDNSKEVIQRWISKNKDIKVIYSDNKKNSWCSWTYYNASNLANGKYITFLDWDDFLIKDSFIEKVKMFEKNPKLKIVYGNCYTYSKRRWYISNFQWDLKNRLSKSIKELREMFYTTNPKCSISTSIIDLDFFRKIWWFDPNIQINDWVLNIKIMENIKSENELWVYDTPCFAYRMNEWNMTKNIDNMLKEQKMVIDNYVKDEYISTWYSNIYYEASLLSLRQNKYKKAFSNLKKSLYMKFSFKRLMIFFVYLITPVKLIEKIPSGFKKKILWALWL